MKGTPSRVEASFATGQPASAASLAGGWGPNGFAGGAGRTRALPDRETP